MLDAAIRIWRDKWEVALALVGIVGASWIPTTWLRQGLWSILALLLVVDIVGAVIHEFRMARARHVPVTVFVPGDQIPEGSVLDAYSAMIADVISTVDRVGFEEKEYRARFGVIQNEWALWRDTPLPTDPGPWRRLVRRFGVRVHRLSRKLGEQRVFHVFLRCPSALAVGLGATMGTHHKVVVHHYQPGEGESPYISVTNSLKSDKGLRAHLGEEVQRPYEHITVDGPTQITAELYVSLFLARHDPRGDADDKAEESESGVVHICRSHPGALTGDDDWLGMAREICDVLLGLVAKRGVSRVHLVLSCPVALAFLLGVALGPHSAVTVHNWFKNEQALYPVMALDRRE